MTPPSNSREPLSKQVYVRRRVTVLVVAIAIIAIFVAILWPRGGDTSPEATSTPAADSDASGPVIGDATPGATGVATPGATPGPGDGDACAPGRVSITANTDAEEYGTGESVELWLTLQNNSANDCVMDVSPDVQWYQITSPTGGDPEVYWTSTDCQEASETPAPPQVLKAGVPISTPPITWDRKRSVAGDCEPDSIAARDTVGGGGASFDLVVRVGTLESDPRRIFLY